MSLRLSSIHFRHGLRTPREDISFTVRPKIQTQSQIFRYEGSIFCLPHRPKFSDIFDLCLHWVSVVRDFRATKGYIGWVFLNFFGWQKENIDGIFRLESEKRIGWIFFTLISNIFLFSWNFHCFLFYKGKVFNWDKKNADTYM